MRVLIEALHIAAGIAVALLIAALCAWAYPLAERDVWLVSGGAILCIILLGIGPLRRAQQADRARHDAGKGTGDA